MASGASDAKRSAEQLILECKRLKKNVLDLRRTGLKTLPASVESFAFLKEIDLSDNEFDEVPAGLFKLRRLAAIHLDRNGISQIPPELATLPHLQNLSLTGNCLNDLPSEISQCLALRELNLSHNRLLQFPEAVTRLENLQILNLSYNKIADIPASVMGISALRTLDLSHNEISWLPSEIGLIANLEKLDINNNSVRALPDSIANLKSIKTLYLYGNRFDALPPEVIALKSLQSLSISRNRIKALPPELGSLINLTSLFIYDNELEDLPEQIGLLTNLVLLSMHKNCFTSVPTAVIKLDKLKSLDISANELASIPAEIGNFTLLESLNVSNNKIRSLPVEIGRCRSLTVFRINKNMLHDIPPQIVDIPSLREISIEDNPFPSSYFDALRQGLDSFRALLNSLAEQTEPLFEAKLLVTGEGQVGKSWALAKLRGQDPGVVIGMDNTTWGIDRGELRLTHPDLEGEEILLNTWDFGGQKIYRVTHQFFFSEQAIFILVWNPRQGAEQCRVREWLRMIALRTGSQTTLDGGDKAEPRAKVIMVATHAQSEGGSYNPDYGRANLDTDLQLMIADEIEIDSRTGHNIDALRKMIARHAATLPDMGQPFNTRWSAARQAVLALRNTKPWIDFDTFSTTCAAHGVTGSQQLRTLAWTYLHSLGRAVWYGSASNDVPASEEALLADTIVLDAVWLSRAFVQVLDDKATQEAGGMLQHSRLSEIWTNHGRAGWHRYKPQEYEILKLVMRRFDVALPTRESQGTRSLVPQLVPYHRPVVPWTNAGNAPGPRTIRLSCVLGYEATGLMARLIAATEPWHVYTDGTGLFWEEGAFLCDTASFSNQALLTVQGTERPQIDLAVSGDQPAFLMHEIYKVIEATLRFWKGMTKAYFVGCPTKCYNGAYCNGKFKYDAIIRRIKDNIDRNFDCEECDCEWSPPQLILGFEALAVDSNYILNHLYHRDQLPSPRMFLLELSDKNILNPTSWAGFVGKRFKLTLLSELSGQKVESAEFSLLEEWVGWVKPLARVASLALTGAALPIDGELAAQFTEGAALLDKLDALPGAGDVAPSNLGEDGSQRVFVTKDQLAKFREFLNAIGLDPRHHGMDIAQGRDGRWLWMTADEVRMYTPQEAAKL